MNPSQFKVGNSVNAIILPNEPLPDCQLTDAVKKLKIPNFRGVFLRNELPKIPRKKECGIMNLDDGRNDGTHWIAWHKSHNESI